MRALKTAVYNRLVELFPESQVHYVEAPPNTATPIVTYWLPSQDRGNLGAFLSEDRDYTFSIQCASGDDDVAEEMREKVRDAFNYKELPVYGWTQEGKIEWDGGIPNPGDRLEDDEIVYYEGDTYRISLSRTRTVDVGG